MLVFHRLFLYLSLMATCLPGIVQAGTAPAKGLEQIKNIVIIYAENRSFDHLYGLFPGAEGIAQASTEQKTQLDLDGRPLAILPPAYDRGKVVDGFPTGLPNGPFRIDAPPVNRRIDELLISPIHNFWQSQAQINGGKNNQFVAHSNAGAWVMGHFDGSTMKLWKWALEYTLADHFFMGAFGGSFLNHQWLICACTPVDRDAAEKTRPRLDEQGRLIARPGSPLSVMNGPVQQFDGSVTPDGYSVNTSQPPYQPSGIPPAAPGQLELADNALGPVPPQTSRTIGDTLSAKGISWAWYAGGWNEAQADGRRAASEKRQVIYNFGADALAFQPHHQPFNYHSRFAPGSADRARHLLDGSDFFAAIDAGRLPAVSFYKPVGRFNEHPSYTDLAKGDEHLDALLQQLRRSPQWPGMMIIVAYDENGGFWDHVPPPSGPGWSDRWGPGSRVPALVISPFAKRAHVDKTPYDTTSIIKLISRRFELEALPGVREKAGDLTQALSF